MTSVNTAKTRSFPGADIGSDHELVMMTFWFRLKKIKMKGSTRIKFDLEKLKTLKLQRPSLPDDADDIDGHTNYYFQYRYDLNS